MKKEWQTKNLGELCRIRTGKKDVNEGNPDGEFPFFTCAAEHTFSDNYSFDTEALLIAGNGDVGKVSYYKGKFEAYQRTYVLSDFTEVLPRFLFLILDGKLRDTVSKQKLGNTMPYIKVGMLTDFQLPVPPLAEQQRIVGLLDEAFEGLATAKANAEKNLQNARALFESHLQSVFTQRGPGWVDRQLASLCHEITVGHVGSMKTEYKDSGIPFLRSQNIRPFEVSMENAMFIDETFHRALKKSQLRPGDLAIVRTGYPGTAAVIPPELPDSNCSDLVIVRPGKEVNPHFLAAFFNSAFGKQLVLGKIVGAAQKHFNITAAKEVMLHVPPIPEQRTIVAMVADLREETQHLARIYSQKLAALEALKKSLLHQAFAGAL